MLLFYKNISCGNACNTQDTSVILIHDLLLSESKLEGHRTEFVGTTTLGSVLKRVKGMVLDTAVARNLESAYWLPRKGRMTDKKDSLP